MFNRPAPALLRRGSQFGQHVRPSRADDDAIQQLVRVIFAPTAPFHPCDPALVRQLFDRAPRPDKIGVGDWDRPMRADEVAEIWGTPMEGPDTRHSWLLRADEIARAWGRGVLGPGGLVDELGADVPDDLPMPPAS